jgi:transcription termination factor 2
VEKINNEELNDLYNSPNIFRVIKSRRMRWVGHLARMEGRRSVYGVLVGKPEGKRPLGKPMRRWEDNIKWDLQEVRCGGMDVIGLAQSRDRWRALVNVVMNLRIP